MTAAIANSRVGCGAARYLPARRLTIPVAIKSGVRRSAEAPIYGGINVSEPVLAARHDGRKMAASNHAAANRSLPQNTWESADCFKTRGGDQLIG